MTAYLTVGEELIEYADAVLKYLKDKGYRVTVEESKFEYPYTPTFIARRSPKTLICEVHGKLDVQRAESWVYFARSRPRDTRVLIAISDQIMVKPAVERKLSELGVGILVVSTDGSAYEKLASMDQAVSVGIPALSAMPRKVAVMLHDSYEKFERGEWRDGFKKACQTVEARAREHLIQSVQNQRVTFVKANGSPLTYNVARLKRMTAGQLAAAYAQIASPNYTDKLVEQALSYLNSDRVGAVHHEDQPQTERALRKNVGNHMIIIIKTLDELAA